MASKLALLSLMALTKAADISWCKEAGCNDCPSAITTSGPGHPECVIYDTETVFGGQGFKEVTDGKVLYEVFAKNEDPCGGAPGAIMVRSPASLATEGCGNLIHDAQDAECSSKSLRLQETFMVQFCCGAGDCNAANVPWGKRSLGARSATFKFENGTVIEPIAVGSPPELSGRSWKPSFAERREVVQPERRNTLASRQCEGYDEYIQDGEPYLKTFNTQIVTGVVGPFDKDETIDVKYDQSESRTTSFSLSVGDPWGILSATVGFEFTDSETIGFTASVPVRKGEVGRVGFTAVHQCTKGKIVACNEDEPDQEGESCTPWVLNGVVQGDYALVST